MCCTEISTCIVFRVQLAVVQGLRHCGAPGLLLHSPVPLMVNVVGQSPRQGYDEKHGHVLNTARIPLSLMVDDGLG